jgi:hypothetical protein
MYDLDDYGEEEDEIEPKVKYSFILQKEDYESDEEDDPIPYCDIGPGYYFFSQD